MNCGWCHLSTLDVLLSISLLGPHCQRLHPTWESLAKKLNAVGIRVGRVNVQQARRASAPYNIQGVPTIKMFPAGKTGSGKRPVDYNGQRDLKALATFAVQRLPKSASQLSNDNFQQILSTGRHLTLLTTKKSAPHLFNGVCLAFQEDLKCSWAQGSESDVLAHFGVEDDDLPVILYSDETGPQKYSGNAHFDDIADWLDQTLSPSSEKPNPSDSSDPNEDNSSTSPPASKEIPPFSLTECQTKSFCLLPIVDAEPSSEEIKHKIDEIAAYWDKSKISVGWIAPESPVHSQLMIQIFGGGIPDESIAESESLSGWFLLRPSKGKATFIEPSRDVVELVSNGNIEWTRVEKGLGFLQ